MGDLSSLSPPPSSMNDAAIVSLSAKIMVISIVVIFFIVVFLCCLHLYSRWYWSTHEDPTIVSWRRRTARQGQGQRSARAHRRGLDPSTLKSLPMVVYNPKDFKDGLECAVCLSEVKQGEKARVLPKCNHGFHVECIDMWFQSHSTCPLCRNPVVISSQNPPNNNPNDNEVGASNSSSESESESDGDINDDGVTTEAPVFPTNVLFWGDETQVRSLGQATNNDASSSSTSSTATSSGTNGVGSRNRDELVIEIPRELCDDCFLSPIDEGKSPTVMKRLRSLKRLLSRGKRVAPSPRDSSSAEVEQV